MIKYTIYSKPNCPWCSLAKHVLEVSGVEHRIIFLEDESDRAQVIDDMKENYQVDHNTFPIVIKTEVSIGTDFKFTFIGGCTEMIEDLEKSGYKVSKV